MADIGSSLESGGFVVGVFEWNGLNDGRKDHQGESNEEEEHSGGEALAQHVGQVDGILDV